ncbi:hypothetical protein [Mesorhizobium dulcispinae]|uniref:hypothetical protein n=1 Tax=Mesorhizobium dulcispinae TaxID=3072316 RepID=UPI002A24332C|nr:hypothetical protein [Mesorhizobium sp. VK23D]MDX8521142.1 hypothetical protein [Mesorhizobium sp. VK23D]
MSDGPAADPYATAKANLRDTIKWLATTLAALGAAVVAGASISGLATLEGQKLILASACGAAGLIAILIAIGIMVNLLTSSVFYFSQLADLTDPVTSEINSQARDILPPQTPTIADLIAFQESAVTDMRATRPGDDLYQSAYKRYLAANDAIARVNNLAQFLFLRNRFRGKTLILFGLTVFIIFSLGGYSLLAGGKVDTGGDLATKILFVPGDGWAAAAASLSGECGAQPLNGVMLQRKPFEGWVGIRLTGPGKCSGLDLFVPASLVQLVGPV